MKRLSLLKNTNAQQGEEKKSAILNIRVTKSEKEKWKRHADNENQSLACWVEKTLNEKCESLRK